jgi:hypothetical protein
MRYRGSSGYPEGLRNRIRLAPAHPPATACLVFNGPREARVTNLGQQIRAASILTESRARLLQGSGK